MHISRFTPLTIFTLLLLIPNVSRADALNAAAKNAALGSITGADVKQHVDTLADDTFEGREAGSRGNRAAGIYMVERMKKLGFRGGGTNGSYYQSFGNYRNILALAEGRDPKLKAHTVVIGAHYDHVGYGTNRNSYGPIGLIHNGADDNASGVAALLEIMEAVSKLPERPRRSILFAFWDGEEKGLLGSQHWIAHPTVPLAEVPIMINVDMIGRLRKGRVELYGVRTSPGLRRLVSTQNTSDELTLDFNWDVRADSDHHTFYARNIPFLMLHTGKHGDYHRPSDDAERVNTDGLAQISRLMFNVLVELAESPTLPGFRSAARGESQSMQRSRERAVAGPPGRLGLRWDPEVAKKSGQIVVAGVTPRSAADLAGLKPGDKIVKFAGRKVAGEDLFRRTVLAATNPVPVTLERAGEEKPIDLTLTLTGEPVRLGIGWRTDEAEPNTIIVNRVTPGSAADQAGVRVGDRIYRVGGRDFADGEEFRWLAVNAAGMLPLEVETAGKVRTVKLQLVGLGATAVSDDDGAAESK